VEVDVKIERRRKIGLGGQSFGKMGGGKREREAEGKGREAMSIYLER
jgi:hypothetical protein